MDSGRIRRILIALTAAYAMALHALLLSFVPLSAAALGDSGSVLCTYNDTDDSRHPARHQVPCVAVCAAIGHGIAGAVPPVVAEIFVSRLFAAIVTPSVHWVSPNIVAIGPQTSRGPPAV